MNKLIAPLLLLATTTNVQADGSPWLPPEESISLGLSVTNQVSDRFFIAADSTSLGGDLEGRFVWLDGKYGLTDYWALDARVGYAETTFETNLDSQQDFANTTIGVTYQWLNEYELDDGTPTVATRLALVIAGDYETEIIDAIGDGASGLDLNLLVGRELSSLFSASADLGFRTRNNDVPDSFTYMFALQYSGLPRVGLQLALAGVRSDGDVDIGDPGFGVDQFPRTDRDSNWVLAGANFSIGNGIGFGLSYASVTSGRNIPDSDIASISVNYAF